MLVRTPPVPAGHFGLPNPMHSGTYTSLRLSSHYEFLYKMCVFSAGHSVNRLLRSHYYREPGLAPKIHLLDTIHGLFPSISLVPRTLALSQLSFPTFLGSIIIFLG